MVATAVGIGDGEDKPLWELSDAHSTKLRNWNLRTAALSVVSDSLDHSWNCMHEVLHVSSNAHSHVHERDFNQCGRRVLTLSEQNMT